MRSNIDECVFYRGSVMHVLYTDDSILAGPDLKEVERTIEDIKKAKLDITIEGNIQDFLGVNIDRKKDGTIHSWRESQLNKGWDNPSDTTTSY